MSQKTFDDIKFRDHPTHENSYIGDIILDNGLEVVLEYTKIQARDLKNYLYKKDFIAGEHKYDGDELISKTYQLSVWTEDDIFEYSSECSVCTCTEKEINEIMKRIQTDKDAVINQVKKEDEEKVLKKLNII